MLITVPLIIIITVIIVALEMKKRQVELNRVEEELKKRNQEILDLQLRLHEAEKTLVRQLPYMVCECFKHLLP